MKIKSVSIALVGTLALASTLLAQGDWTVGFDRPPAVGIEVGRGEHNNHLDPDLRWQAPDDGLLQTIFFDADPKCDEEVGYVRIEKDGSILANYPIPTAAWDPDKDCWNPHDSEYTSRIFDVESGMYIDGDIGQTSGWFVYEFATHTPTPTALATVVLPPVTPEATGTPTSTPVPPTPTNTPTPWPTIVGTPPEPLSTCLSVSTVPPLPTAIPAEGFVADLYVKAVNPDMYVLYVDEVPYVYSEQQPLVGITFLPNKTYTVRVAEEAEPCKLAPVPTGLEVEPQPQNGIYLPVISQ